MKYEGIYDYLVEHWHKFLETNDSSKLIGIDNPVEFSELCHSQLIDEFGVSIEFEMMFYKKNDLLRWELAKIQGDKSADGFIQTIESEIDYIKSGVKATDNLRKHHADLRRAIETTFPGRVIKGMTIFDFYNDIHDITNMQKERENKEYSKMMSNG
jgi:hypothetical protein